MIYSFGNNPLRASFGASVCTVFAGFVLKTIKTELLSRTPAVTIYNCFSNKIQNFFFFQRQNLRYLCSQCFQQV